MLPAGSHIAEKPLKVVLDDKYPEKLKLRSQSYKYVPGESNQAENNDSAGKWDPGQVLARPAGNQDINTPKYILLESHKTLQTM